MSNFKNYYKTNIIPSYLKTFKITNKYEIPILQKIIIHCNLGISAENPIVFKKAIEELRLITGQHPKFTKTKKAISQFKLKKNINIGLMVTLRNEKMYFFLEKLIHLVFPKIRDFNGFDTKLFDKNGNYNFGLKEQFLFPEIVYESIEKIHGFNITFVIKSNNILHNLFLLKQFNFPFKE